MQYRFGSSTSARVAIPLGAALVAAVVLPALLLQTHDSVTLPTAAPAASDSRIVHTPTQPKPVPKHRATAKHARRAGGAAAHVTPLANAQSSPASGRAKAHPEHATAQAQAHATRMNAKATGNQATATSKHVAARQAHVAATVRQQDAPGQSAARQHKSKPKHHVHAKKVHTARRTAPHSHKQHEPKQHVQQHNGKGKS